jgi:pimeloyl-ACP methyl ester carboxylesterase
VPADPAVRGFDDLVERVVAEIDQPVALLAQSMGGIIAVRAALAKPALVRCLVLAVTSGGIDTRALGASEWQVQFARANPGLPRWFLDERRDITEQLTQLQVPTLLLWGDVDPISPVAVGQKLAALLPRAELHVISGADHDLVSVHAPRIVPLIEQHLSVGADRR